MMKEFEKLFAHMEYHNVLDEIKENISSDKINITTMKEMMNKSDLSFWVQMNSNYCINKLNMALTILYITVNHKQEDDMLTFSCIDSNKAYYTIINSQDLDIISFKLHRNDFFEFIFVLEGELEVVIENISYRYRRGDICIINCNILHRKDNSKDFRAAYLCLTKEYLNTWTEEEMAELENDRIACFLKDNLAGKAQNTKNYLNFIYLGEFPPTEVMQAEQELLDISNELINHRPGYKSIVKGMITRLFYTLQDSKTYTSKYIKLDSIAEGSLFELAVQYMEEKKRRVTRNELANALHYNGDYINQIFVKHTGGSLHDYNMNLCLREAKKLLLDTSLSVSDIIKRLGFENRTSFYQQFLKRFGMTPMQYRAENEKK